MTNFFGSVMETIHTDHPYRSSKRQERKVKIEMPLDDAVQDKQRRLLLNVGDQNNGPKIEVRLIHCLYHVLPLDMLSIGFISHGAFLSHRKQKIL